MLQHSLIALLAAALVGCATTTTPTPEPEPTDTPQTEATPTPEAEATPTMAEPTDNLPEGYTLYRNEEVGFAIGYPEGWYLTETNADVAYITSFDMENAPATEGLPANETKVDVLFSQPPRAESVEAYIEQNREEENPFDTEVANVEELTVLDGTDAALITFESERGSSTTFFTVYNGYSILMTPFGDSEQFERMIDTLRPIDAEEETAFPAPERVEWNNACLELPEEGEACAEGITPGWRVMVDADGTPVEAHTGENAEQIRIGG